MPRGINCCKFNTPLCPRRRLTTSPPTHQMAAAKKDKQKKPSQNKKHGGVIPGATVKLTQAPIRFICHPLHIRFPIHFPYLSLFLFGDTLFISQAPFSLVALKSF